jgi:CRISPR-associated protein Cmr3
MIAEIRPLDTLFFKDGKPFSRGDETWADGVFPPYPSVVYGALRTWFISQQPGGLSGDILSKSEKIKINHICYEFGGNEIMMPMPLDLAESKDKSASKRKEEKEKSEYEVVGLVPEMIENRVSNYPFKMVLMPQKEQLVEEVEQGFIAESAFMTYLNAPDAYFSVKKLADIVQTEPKVGIGRNYYTNTAKDSMLYRVGMRRASSFRLRVDFDLPDGAEVGHEDSYFIKLGAENKVAEMHIASSGRTKISSDDIELTSRKFKLYLSTPAIFIKNGWYPDLTAHNINATLVAAAVGKPLHIGGFDMKGNKPKNMFKAVPAGSVFFYEAAESENMNTLKERLFGKSISEEMKDQGFGIAYIGKW